MHNQRLQFQTESVFLDCWPTASVYLQALKTSSLQRLLSLPQCSSLHMHPPHRISPAVGRRHQRESRLVPAI